MQVRADTGRVPYHTAVGRMNIKIQLLSSSLLVFLLCGNPNQISPVVCGYQLENSAVFFTGG